MSHFELVVQSEGWYSISEHFNPGILENDIILGLLRPSFEELLHATVQNIRLESHQTLQESVTDNPHNEYLVAH